MPGAPGAPGAPVSLEPGGAFLGLVAVVYLAGGLVKGTLGLGLPLVVVPVMAVVIGPARAVALMAVPALVSNLVQALHTSIRGWVLGRFWPAMLAMAAGAVLGSRYLAGADPRLATGVLGIVVLLFCASQLLRSLPPIPRAHERWLTALVAGIGGVAGGFTGFFGLPTVPWLIAMRLDPETFVAILGSLYLVGVVALFGSLLQSGLLDGATLALSTGAAVPTLAGTLLGARLRRRLAPEAFRRVLLGVLALVGVHLAVRAWFAGP